jgi:16S rRNA (cytidine1402-2'-O)-methyltransferase
LHLGTLYVVSTPIGNLEDVTLRALRILREATVIAAEDTRHTRKLLAHYDIHTPLISYHEHSDSGDTGAGAGRTAYLIARMVAGESVALVTDAGTPGISDPGIALVDAAIASGVNVVPIPGASAVLAALVASGLPLAHFVFDGFLPRTKSSRRDKLASLARAESRTMVFYEAANRTAETLSALAEAFGPNRPCVVGREITKRHEQFLRGTLGDVAVEYRSGEARGEVTIIVGGLPSETAAETPAPREETVEGALRAMLNTGASERDAVRAVSAELKKSRREVYTVMLALKAAKSV